MLICNRNSPPAVLRTRLLRDYPSIKNYHRPVQNKSIYLDWFSCKVVKAMFDMLWACKQIYLLLMT